MKMGLELEFSDIKTVVAAQLLYTLWGRDPDTWQDRYGGYAKPTISYDEWNCMSDGSLVNSDGTRCMWSYIDEDGKKRGASSAKKSPDRVKWKGIEVISPASDDLPKLVSEMRKAVEILGIAGATAKMGHFNSMHIHVDISDNSFEEVTSWIPKIHESEEQLRRLDTRWKKLSNFTDAQVEELMDLREELLSELSSGWGNMTEELAKREWYQRYRTVPVRGGHVKTVHYQDDRQRRFVDVSPYFSQKPYDTMEFRCFRSSLNSEFLTQQIEIAHQFTVALKLGLPYEKVAGETLEQSVDRALEMYEEV